jgi:hypothetical protein
MHEGAAVSHIHSDEIISTMIRHDSGVDMFPLVDSLEGEALETNAVISSDIDNDIEVDKCNDHKQVEVATTKRALPSDAIAGREPEKVARRRTHNGDNSSISISTENKTRVGCPYHKKDPVRNTQKCHAAASASQRWEN